MLEHVCWRNADSFALARTLLLTTESTIASAVIGDSPVSLSSPFKALSARSKVPNRIRKNSSIVDSRVLDTALRNDGRRVNCNPINMTSARTSRRSSATSGDSFRTIGAATPSIGLRTSVSIVLSRGAFLGRTA